MTRKGDRIWKRFTTTTRPHRAKWHTVRWGYSSYCGLLMYDHYVEENREDNLLEEECCMMCWKSTN